MICEPGDVVVVPFPFVDRREAKRRPALVLSGRSFNEAGHCVLAMITTQSNPPWPGDTMIADRDSAGLRVPCVVRIKLFTLDIRLILKKAGHLSPDDQARVGAQIREHVTR